MLSIPCFSVGQFTENFSDGNLTQNPVWTGNLADFTINPEGQLQSNATALNYTFHLSTANTLATSAQWDFWVRLAFNPSGANFTDVYLTASQSNVTLGNTSGYFVRLGDTPDEISLYRKDANGASIKIIDGQDGLLNSSNNIVRVRVTRNATNQWTLLRDAGATGSFIPEGTVQDATYNTSAFFAILIRQSTASFVQRHFFDDIEVKAFTPDITPPVLVSAEALSTNSLAVLFNEAVTEGSALNVSNYVVNNGIGNPVSVTRDPANPLRFILAFNNNFPNGTPALLTANGISDLAGNVLVNGTASFAFYVPRRFDVVIHEIMADPQPPVALPNANWIELRNTAAFPINLQGYRLQRSAGASGPMPAYILQPDSFVIVTTASQVAALSVYGAVLSVTSFPTLPIGGDVVWLTDATGQVMHSVSYNSNWYQNAVKANGGWTLEMIDARNACSGADNWRASNHPSGGTPGGANSIAAANPDRTPPILLQANAPNARTIILRFNESMDSSTTAAATYAISNGIGNPTAVSLVPPAFNQVVLSLATPLQPGIIYTATVANAADCSGNRTGNAGNSARVGLAQQPDTLDIVLNEILFDPPALGVDYLEIYNRSNRIIDLGNTYFTNRSSTTGNPGNLIPLSTTNRLLFPGEYYALTESSSILAQTYKVLFPEAIAESTMPSLPNDKGTVLIMNQSGKIVDEVSYDSRWHFALISNPDGVALERIDFNQPTQKPDNWTSAAQSAGFGTPGYQNSQYRKDITAPAGNIVINPAMFSPDNDGFEDFALIEFTFNEPGYVANVTIYDAAGRPVRILQRNTTIAASGTFRWDGLNDKQQRVPAGNYVILFEAFNLQGKKQVLKKGVTVARKF